MQSHCPLHRLAPSRPCRGSIDNIVRRYKCQEMMHRPEVHSSSNYEDAKMADHVRVVSTDHLAACCCRKQQAQVAVSHCRLNERPASVGYHCWRGGVE